MSTVLWILAVLLVVIGVVGIVVPMLPGIVLVLLGLVFAAWADGFQVVGWRTISLLAGLTILGLLADYYATVLGVQRAKASKQAVTGSLIGAVIGMFFGFVGIFIGPFIGAAAGEYLARRDMAQAGRAGFGTWVGILLGAVVKLALVFSMIGLFAVSYILNK